MGQIIAWILNACFPRFCVSCKAEGEILCASCREKFDDRVYKEGGEHMASFAYANPIVRQLICAWKYNFDQSAWKIIRGLGEGDRQKLAQLLKREGIEAIVPVPLSRRRSLERGFNQAAMVGEWISEASSVPVALLIERKETRGHQAERTHEERRLAMKDNPFACRGGCRGGSETLPYTRILVVDDVWTTGATMKAAEEALKAGGVEKVYFYTLAEG